MIKNIVIENYRSIKKVSVNLGPINFFVGQNNAGKSNIMKALTLVLGDVYPSVRSFDDKDFHNYNKSNPIKIIVMFDSPLVCNPRVFGFLLTYNGTDSEFYAVDQYGSILTYYPGGREIRVSTDMKEEVALMYLGLDRQANQQVRATQWTLYGKLLRYIEKQIATTQKEAFKNGVKTSYDNSIFPNLQAMENILQEHVKHQTGLDLHLRLSLLDPIETMKNIKPYLNEGSSTTEFDAEDMGAGTQSAIAVAIARAYGDIVRKPLVMVIEEPELYMHPHGCRHFYRILKELSTGNVQVICTTHERCFIDISNFQSIHLTSKETIETEIASGVNRSTTSQSLISQISKFDEEINEVFFARRVVLVEGIADKIACKLALEKLGLDLDMGSVSIVECGSINSVKPIAEVLKLFNIKTFVLVDEDPGNPQTAGSITQLKSLLGNDKVFIQSPTLEGVLGLIRKPTKVDALTLFPNWFNTNTAPSVYVQLKNAIIQ